MQTHHQILQQQVTSENLAVSGVFRTYRQHLLAAGIPEAEHGYSIRWLKLYLATCWHQTALWIDDDGTSHTADALH